MLDSFAVASTIKVEYCVISRRQGNPIKIEIGRAFWTAKKRRLRLPERGNPIREQQIQREEREQREEKKTEKRKKNSRNPGIGFGSSCNRPGQRRNRTENQKRKKETERENRGNQKLNEEEGGGRRSKKRKNK